MTTPTREQRLEALIRQARGFLASLAVGPVADCFCVQCSTARLIKAIDLELTKPQEHVG